MKTTNTKLVARQEIYDLYWYYAYERYMILQRRLSGQHAPWTSDPILQQYKFCNTLRYTDRVSQDLIARVINQPTTKSDDIFRVVLYRFFSKPETFAAIEQGLGHKVGMADLESSKLADILDDLVANGKTIYTNAFILCAPRGEGYTKKHHGHIELFRYMFLLDNFGQKSLACTSMKELTLLLQTYPLIGPFMSYQIANDLCYLQCMRVDPDTFTIAGPGALRGIAKTFIDIGKSSPADVIMHMFQNQKSEFARLGYEMDAELGLVDCQGVFCELDKYCRVAKPSLTSARTRIKNKYKTPMVQQKIVWPLKWKSIHNV